MNTERNVVLLMTKAAESLGAAAELIEGRHWGFSASRSYYGMFYAAEAVLLERGMQFRKHSAVISHFNKAFIKAGIIPTEASKWFQKASDLRRQGDYGTVPVAEEEARKTLAEARQFVSLVSAHLRDHGYDL